MDGLNDREIRTLWNMVFNLSLNFLHDENLAEDAAQDIFLKAGEARGDFREDATLSTWVYRIAYNHLVDQKRKGFTDEISFELFEQDVNHFKPFENEINLSEEEMKLYAEQIKVGCTKAMLQCLDPRDRFIFILGRIFALSGREGASVCGMSESSYRQRLSRAARKIRNFMTLNCGLISEEATCRCRRRVSIALERGRINPDKLLHHSDSGAVKDYLESMNRLDEIALLYRDNPFIDRSELLNEELCSGIRALACRTI